MILQEAPYRMQERLEGDPFDVVIMNLVDSHIAPTRALVKLPEDPGLAAPAGAAVQDDVLVLVLQLISRPRDSGRLRVRGQLASLNSRVRRVKTCADQRVSGRRAFSPRRRKKKVAMFPRGPQKLLVWKKCSTRSWIRTTGV